VRKSGARNTANNEYQFDMNENGDAYDRELFEQLATDPRRGALREAPGRAFNFGKE
jgi:hypothetical protein